LTFDDGPYQYTGGILDLLDEYNMKATFFITGINIGKGSIDDPSKPWRGMIKRMYDSGHQVASHSWSHADLSAVDEETRTGEMVKLEMATRNIFGKIPTYMRPPYSSCTAACQQTMTRLGYHVTNFDLDTSDYLNTQSAEAIQYSKDVFYGNLTSVSPTQKSWLDIEHDIHFQTATNLVPYQLQVMRDLGYKGVTVGKCLQDPEANWYRNA